MSTEEHQDGRTREGGAATPDAETVRALLDQLRVRLSLAIDAWEAELTAGTEEPPPAPRFSRPAAVPPVRMEQLHRTPQPTADLDDLVDVLAPRLLERLVPALREALQEERAV